MLIGAAADDYCHRANPSTSWLLFAVAVVMVVVMFAVVVVAVVVVVVVVVLARRRRCCCCCLRLYLLTHSTAICVTVVCV